MTTIDLIKQLREQTGAGVSDIKEALTVSNNDIEAAKAYLRKKGVAKADKRQDRETNQGVIVSYVHSNNKIAVLVELNCETDYVARNEEFQTLARELALQICANNPEFLSENDVPENIRSEFEREVRNDPKFANKPDSVLAQIVDSKVKTYAKEKSLLSQPYFRDSSKTIDDLIKEFTAKCGEKIVVRRFVRWELGS